MALKATIYKAELQLADMDRNVYGDFSLTLAQHPSETLERMMLRLLVFALNADEQLSFCRGVSATEEPDLWQKNLHGGIDLWIELGQPEEKRIRKACGLAERVRLYSYSGGSAAIWWSQIEPKLAALKNIEVFNFAPEVGSQLEQLVDRSMALQCTIQDGVVWLSSAERVVEVVPQRLFPA